MAGTLRDAADSTPRKRRHVKLQWEATARLLVEAHTLAGRASPPATSGRRLAALRVPRALLGGALSDGAQTRRERGTYDDVLRNWSPAVGRRDRGLYQARLAIACAASGQPDRARAEGGKALAIARATSITPLTTARHRRDRPTRLGGSSRW